MTYSHRAIKSPVAFAAAAVAVSLLASACATNGSESTSISVYNWGNADEARIYDEIFAEFSAANGDIEITNSVVPVTLWGDYVSKLATQVAGGDTPDLLNMAMEGTRLSVDRGLLEPLDQYVDEGDLAALLADIPQPLLDAYTVDGKLYEVPSGWQTMVIYANTDIFAEAGVPIPDADWTWEEFLDVAQRLTTDEVKGFGLPWGFFQLQPWIMTNGGSMVSGDYSTPNLTDPAVVEAVAFVKDLVQTHGVSSDPTAVDVYTQFSTGAFAMIGAGRWPIPGWNEAGFDSYVALPWPQKTNQATVFGGSGWGISPGSPNKELAAAAISQLVSKDSIAALADLGQQIPSYSGVASTSGNQAADAALVVLEQQVDIAQPVPAPAFYDTLESVTMRYMVQIVTGEIGVEEGLAAAQAEIEQAIS